MPKEPSPSDEGLGNKSDAPKPSLAAHLRPLPPDHELKELFSELFLQLHTRAQQTLGKEHLGHTLQPTALVSEAYLRLQKNSKKRWNDPDHFLLVASRAMRCVLVDHYRAKNSIKRYKQQTDVDVTLIAAPYEELAVDLDALDQALTKLEKSEPQMAQAVQLRFFAGASMEEISRLLDISLRTLERRLTIVRAWLHGEVSG